LGVQAAWTAVLGFCQGSVCDLVAYVRAHVNPPDPATNHSGHGQGGFASFLNSTCAQRKQKRSQHCQAVSNLRDTLSHEYCNSSHVLKTVTVMGKEVVVTESDVCDLVRQELLENEFDDDKKPAWTGWLTPDKWPHGLLFWQADEFCSKNLLNKGECAVAAPLVLAEISNLCGSDADDGSSSGPGGSSGLGGGGDDGEVDPKTELACEVGKYVVANLQGIDKTLALWPQYCDVGTGDTGHFVLDVCNDHGNGTGRVGEAVLEFCNLTTLEGFKAVLSSSDDDFGTYGHLGLALAEQCPFVVTTVQSAVGQYCSDEEKPFHAFECSVVRSIPWGEVPFSESGGPVLWFLENELVPRAQNLTAQLSEWCYGDATEEVPAWRGDACEALETFAAEELKRAFDLAVSKVDALLPDLDLAASVNKAGDWLQCSLGASRWEGVPEPFGYVMPLTWADEWLEVPPSITDEFKAEIQSTQVSAATAKLWLLVLSGLSALGACVVVVARRLAKRDYEADERLLGRDLVLGKEHLFAGLEDYGLVGGGDRGGGGGEGGGGGGGGMSSRVAGGRSYQPPSAALVGGGVEDPATLGREESGGKSPFASAWV